MCQPQHKEQGRGSELLATAKWHFSFSLLVAVQSTINQSLTLVSYPDTKHLQNQLQWIQSSKSPATNTALNHFSVLSPSVSAFLNSTLLTLYINVLFSAHTLVHRSLPLHDWFLQSVSAPLELYSAQSFTLPFVSFLYTYTWHLFYCCLLSSTVPWQQCVFSLLLSQIYLGSFFFSWKLPQEITCLLLPKLLPKYCFMCLSTG